MPDDDDQILDDEDLEDEDLEDEDEEGDEGDENESSTPPVDIASLVKRLDATESTNKELRESVARFQSLLARLPEDPNKAEREALSNSVDDVYDILNAIAGSEDALFDDNVKERVRKAAASRQQARVQQSTEQQVQQAVVAALRAAGVPVPGEPGGAPDPRQQAAELTARLETELVGEIRSYGLNPDDFDWDEASEILGKSGPDGLRAHIRTQIRTAIADEGRAARRQSRKASSSRSPRGGSPTPSGEDVLKGNDEKAKRDFLRSLGVTGV